MLTLPSIRTDSHVRVVACAAPRAESRQAFLDEFGGSAHSSAEDLARDPEVEAVYIATPHQMHREHAEIFAAGGKHLLVEKPLAVSMEDAHAIVEAARRAGVHLITGPSHSFDHPVLKAAEMIASVEYGRPRMIHALNYTDFLYRPRRSEELNTAQGGGVIFSQAVHQIDVVRFLMGARAQKVAAITGAWDTDRPTEGAYSALVSFEGGSFASLTYSGYAHYDSDVLMENVGELGHPKPEDAYGRARRALLAVSTPQAEARLKSSRTYGAVEAPPPAPHAEHFGPVIVSCDRADLRLTPVGVEVWGDTEKSFVPTPPGPSPRAPVLKAIYDTLRGKGAPKQVDDWGRASLEICHAILRSADNGGFITLEYQ